METKPEAPERATDKIRIHWDKQEYRLNLAEACGDMVVRRADGVYVYQLAVTVDSFRQDSRR